MIPTSAPQCPHFIYKSGYRPLWGILVCVFVPFTASSNFHPHFGQYTGRILSLMSFCSTSFLPWRKPVTPFRQSRSGCRGAGLQSVRSYSRRLFQNLRFYLKEKDTACTMSFSVNYLVFCVPTLHINNYRNRDIVLNTLIAEFITLCVKHHMAGKGPKSKDFYKVSLCSNTIVST